MLLQLIKALITQKNISIIIAKGDVNINTK